MLDLNNGEISFKTEKEVLGFSRFFLSSNPIIDSEHEFQDEAEYKDFVARRERQLRAQLDWLRNLDFTKANVTKIECTYYKISKVAHKDPLSSFGASKASSRFNYKDAPLLKNNTIYFGRTVRCCEIEKFQLGHEKELIKKTYGDAGLDPDEIRHPPHNVDQFEVQLENVLVLTSKPSLDAIGINPGAFMNEWYELNEEYEIPSSSQVLGAMARAFKFRGILYKSARYQLENNLVIFEENTGKLEFKKAESRLYAPSSELLESPL